MGVVQRQAALMSGLMLLLTHSHGGKLTSVPVLSALAAAPLPRRSLRVVKAVLVPDSAGGPRQLKRTAHAQSLVTGLRQGVPLICHRS